MKKARDKEKLEIPMLGFVSAFFAHNGCFTQSRTKHQALYGHFLRDTFGLFLRAAGGGGEGGVPSKVSLRLWKQRIEKSSFLSHLSLSKGFSKLGSITRMTFKRVNLSTGKKQISYTNRKQCYSQNV